jgi:hypothetical protein
LKTLSFAHSTAGPLYFVLLHTPAEPDPEEWSAYLRVLRNKVTPEAKPVHVFVATDGGGPNAAQRQDLAHLADRPDRGPVMHVFTNETFARVIVSAFTWIAGARATAHAPAEFPAVCTELGLSPADVLFDLIVAERAIPKTRVMRFMNDAVNRHRLAADRSA